MCARRLRALCFLPCVIAASALSTQAVDQIRVGEVLPALTGQSASGMQVTLPAADSGALRIIVFSFQGASTDFMRWTQRLEKEAPAVHALIYRVVLLQSVPKAFRRITADVVRGGIPRPEWNRTVFLYANDAVWRKRLDARADRNCYLMLIDGNGVVRWIGSGPFSEARYRQLRRAMSR